MPKMDAYITLFICVTALLLLSIKRTQCEVMAPVTLALLGLSISIVLAMIGRASWNQVALGWGSVCIVAIGAAALLFGAFLGRHLLGRQITEASDERILSSVYLTPIWKYVVVATVLVLAIVVRIAETYRIGAELGVDTSSYSTVARGVRNSLAGFMSSEGMRVDVGFSFFERQLEKIAIASGFVATYLCARGITERKSTECIGSFLLLLLSCCFCFATGSRGTVMLYGIALASVLFVLLLRKREPPFRLALRFLVVGAAACCVAAVIFYASGSLVGRTASLDFVEYISFYFGCGTPALQYLLDSVDLPVVAPGVRTFYYLFSVPYKLGLIDAYPSYSIAWVDMGGHGCNIFTGFARYYLDFGLVGVVILSALAGAFMTLVYRTAINKGNPLLVVFAGYLCAYAFDFAREEFIFSKLLSPTQLITVAIMFAITIFLTTSLREDWRRIRSFVARKRVA